MRKYESCRLCGRQCGIDRRREQGFCSSGTTLRMAWGGLHFGEEPPLSGKGGSGTVFFSGCTLGCSICQNFQISRLGMGRDVDDREFLEIVCALKEAGAENLNLVTPSHFIPGLEKILRGIRVPDFPVVWNSSAQESPKALKGIFPLVDVFLPDLKTLDSRLAHRCYGYQDYPAIATSAILEMAERRPVETNSKGVLTKGVLVRHLILPGEEDSTRDVFRWFSKNLKGRAMLSVMSQYTPVSSPDYPDPYPSTCLRKEDYDRALEMLRECDLDDGYIQEWHTGRDWLPDFNKSNPFSSDLSRAVWHWKEGFMTPG